MIKLLMVINPVIVLNFQCSFLAVINTIRFKKIIYNTNRLIKTYRKINFFLLMSYSLK